jgi:hypothetical protein
MVRRDRHRLILLGPLLLATLALPACTQLWRWTPVEDGAPLDQDHVVQHEGVSIQVLEFGVLKGSGAPNAEVRIRNDGRRPVAFGLDGFRLEVDGRLVPPVLDEEGELPSIYLKPGEIYNTRLTFPAVIPGDGHPVEGGPERPAPRTMSLHLAPLVIDEVYHEMPVLTYRNPES